MRTCYSLNDISYTIQKYPTTEILRIFLLNINLKSFSKFSNFQTLHNSLVYPQLDKKIIETILPFLRSWFMYVYNWNLDILIF